jgi:hypothetical protein
LLSAHSSALSWPAFWCTVWLTAGGWPDHASLALGTVLEILGLEEQPALQHAPALIGKHEVRIRWVLIAEAGFRDALALRGGRTCLDRSLSRPSPRPFALLQPGEASLQATAGYFPDGHTLVLGYEDGSVISLETAGRERTPAALLSAGVGTAWTA